MYPKTKLRALAANTVQLNSRQHQDIVQSDSNTNNPVIQSLLVLSTLSSQMETDKLSMTN